MRQHTPDRLRRTRGGRDDVLGCRAAAAQVLVGHVGKPLIVGVGVHGGHEALLDAERLVEHHRDRRQAVGGAGGIRDDPVLGAQCLVIHADDHGRVDGVLGRDRQQHAPGARLEVRLEALPAPEMPRGFDHHVNPEFFPGELRDVG
jgi:hypothetical protein